MFSAGFRKCLSPRALLTSASPRRYSSHTERKLEGKVALITGAASGIGRETAAKFINHGAKVVLADIQSGPGHEAARLLGPNASFIQCDVTNEPDVSRAVDFSVSTHGQLDIMYNNAGVACRTPPSITELDLDSFDRVMSINVRGVLAGVKHAARVMIPRGRGVILCTGSVTGVIGGLAQHAYSVSKSGVIGIVRSAAAELSGHGIRVNCISPMAIPTDFAMDELMGYYPGVDRERLVRMVRELSSLKGEYCEVGDVANAATYLASDDAKFVSGHNLVVDGGFTSFKRLQLPGPDKLD
ncbi:NAD(P)-binding Rossmann-fold superfamily protein [Striga hermonthica]|uniref:NAD(P)-binding Rossmann-fold superfamily protein n=1 Tax=Striga hermonthica TaxID=68872 RepID=A0A9N7NCY9_STRHE|nr:NAD(P)-binding Rossmann-fold superfamily protein [Striga hermonthica]